MPARLIVKYLSGDVSASTSRSVAPLDASVGRALRQSFVVDPIFSCECRYKRLAYSHSLLITLRYVKCLQTEACVAQPRACVYCNPVFALSFKASLLCLNFYFQCDMKCTIDRFQGPYSSMVIEYTAFFCYPVI